MSMKEKWKQVKKITLTFRTKQFSVMETYNNEFDEIIIIFRDQNGGPLEIEDKVILKLLINN